MIGASRSELLQVNPWIDGMSLPNDEQAISHGSTADRERERLQLANFRCASDADRRTRYSRTEPHGSRHVLISSRAAHRACGSRMQSIPTPWHVLASLAAHHRMGGVQALVMLFANTKNNKYPAENSRSQLDGKVKLLSPSSSAARMLVHCSAFKDFQAFCHCALPRACSTLAPTPLAR